MLDSWFSLFIETSWWSGVGSEIIREGGVGREGLTNLSIEIYSMTKNMLWLGLR